MSREIERPIIVFQAVEDITSLSKTKIIKRCGDEESFYISKPRNFASYCFEYCGKLDIQYKNLKFKVNDKEPRADYIVRSSCIVKVYNNIPEETICGSALKESLMKLQHSKKFADVKLILGEEVIQAHKCLLATRSTKFKMMFEANLGENQTNEINIQGNVDNLRKMIDWIYSGDIEFPEDDQEIFDLILMADEYLQEDLKRKCEEELLLRICSTNSLNILVYAFKYNSIVSENLIENCVSNIIDELDKVILDNEDLEEKLQSVPGLMTRMLLFVHQKKHKFKRVAFLSRDSSRDSNFF